jgi:hypothetical protein
MYKLVLFLLLSATLVFAADDPWAKVKDLKTGTELRIIKVGAKQPIMAKMDELTDENLLVIIKNEQTAIPRDQIERIDSRPAGKGTRVTTESKTTSEGGPNGQPVGPRPTPGAMVPGTSSSNSVSMGNKSDFETIYRRTILSAPPQK